METNWKVGDRAYVWYPRKQANARDLKGSIVLVELLEPPGTASIAYYRKRWKAQILLSGYTTTWAKRGRTIYVTPDELCTDLLSLTEVLKKRYSTYLLDQINMLVRYRNEIDDPSRIG